jgi:adenylyl- and sulfurtransferase ThiI
MKVVCLLSGGIDSPVAAYTLGRNGADIILLHMDNRPYADDSSVNKAMELAGKVMELESSNREKLNEIFDEVKKELKQINVGKRSLKAYEKPIEQNDGIYIDRKK